VGIAVFQVKTFPLPGHQYERMFRVPEPGLPRVIMGQGKGEYAQGASTTGVPF
jgi:hypothetical protein